MEQMQHKLEQIESKLNYFIENSPKKLASERNSLHILYSEESRILTKLKKPFVIPKSYNKSLHCSEPHSIVSDYPITDRIEISGAGMASPANRLGTLLSEPKITSDCKHYIIILVDYPKSTTHKNQPSESVEYSGPSDRHAGTVRIKHYLIHLFLL
jgi:hypothetical protein